MKKKIRLSGKVKNWLYMFCMAISICSIIAIIILYQVEKSAMGLSFLTHKPFFKIDPVFASMFAKYWCIHVVLAVSSFTMCIVGDR